MKKINVVMPSMPPFEEYVKEIKDLWETKWLTHSGPKHELLTLKLKEFLKVDNVCLFTNGHLALETAIESLNLKGEIITTPFTFASTTQAIVRCGCTPVFCDIKEEDLTLDADKIEALITDKTVAIVPVHVYGNVCDIEKIKNIADKYDLRIIYDAAHAFGVEYKNKGIGSYGDISMFSFHSTKVFNTVEGGGLTYADENLTSKFKQIRQFGMNGQISVPEVGGNSKMTEMHAAMGLCNIKYVSTEIEKRKKIFEKYVELLSNVEGINIYSKKNNNANQNFAYFPVFFDKEKFGKSRDDVKEMLENNNIFARKYFYPLTSEFEAFQGKFVIQETPIASKISKNILCLPLYADLEIESVIKICEIVLA